MNQFIQWIKIAFRNIIKSRQRTIVTLMAIGFGFAAIALFQGYIHSIYEGLRGSAIHGSGIGHLTIYAKGWEAHGKSDPEAYMIPGKDIEKITRLALKNDHVILASPRLSISGLVSNGKNSTIFIATGVMPEHERAVKGRFYEFQPITGNPLNAKNEFGVEMASALAEHLELAPGGDGVVMGTSLEGQMNALDINIAGTYNTGVADTNDKFIKVPFSFAQSFYDTQKADSIVILLDHWNHTNLVKQQLTDMLASSGIEIEIKTWKQLSVFYKNVRNMMDMIFLFIFIIVFIIVIMSTTNTMGMAVIERTREIGTLRALGLKRRGVSFLFAAEGGLLGLTGCLFGLGIHTLVWAAINYAQPSYIPPGNSTPVSLNVDFLPISIAQLIIFMTLLALISAIVPARRAARQNVVNSLTHV
ncbi:MAG: FtsX-like permease family protein [Desulfobacula sp.]|uniref:ABC transporter permease n=1 Tax=Desulfobacula sp. TaxID=2593537 RepID=UPI0025C277BC|nr:FtsX-like permease family protein [Desulfobacula sp.]MCD4722583.1 FtsX-like permease family protein [Desulfobacula sp.]